MSEATVLDVLNRAFMTIILASTPVLLIALIVGLVISILQATTQVQEQTLSFVPKLLAVFVGLIVFGSFMLNSLITFARFILELIPGVS